MDGTSIAKILDTAKCMSRAPECLRNAFIALGKDIPVMHNTYVAEALIIATTYLELDAYGKRVANDMLRSLSRMHKPA